MEGFTKRELNILKVSFVASATVLSILYVVVAWYLLLVLIPILAKFWVIGKVLLLIGMFAIPVLGVSLVKPKIIKLADNIAVSVLLSMTSTEDYERVKRAIEMALAKDMEGKDRNK